MNLKNAAGWWFGLGLCCGTVAFAAPDVATQIAGASPASASSASAPAATLPAAVRRWHQRVQLCEHFAGEFGGDGSARDRAVTRQMSRLRCQTLAAERVVLLRRYRHQAEVMVVLQATQSAE